MTGGNLQSLVAQGMALHHQARWREAIDHWSATCSMFPNEPLPAVQMGLALFGAGNIEHAGRVLASVHERHPRHPWALFGLGLFQEARQEWETASRTFRLAIQAWPDAAMLHEHLAQCLSRIGQAKQAIEHLDTALRLDPSSASARLLKNHLSRPRKSDIINALIRRFSLGSYLEYNKFTGELAFDSVECAAKSIIFVPELQYDDAQARLRADSAARSYASQAFVALDDLPGHLGARRFDLIFFDPMHVRPDVDNGLRLLPRLLAPGGFLVVHDCNPESVELTSTVRRPGQWLGETYKAFALFHAHNPARSITVSEDYGVGVILNSDLDLAYAHDRDIDYETVAADRPRHLGLIDWGTFQGRLAVTDRCGLMEGGHGAGQPGAA